MRRRLFIMLVLPWLASSAIALPYSYRSWFDNSLSNAVSSSATGETTFNVDVSQLSYGLHALHVEAWNSNGRSSVRTCYFLKGDTPKATKARYWFDSNPSTMHDNVTASGTIDLDVLSLSAGLHAVHYQTFTADGKASSVRTQFFLKGETPMATKARYWFDSDPSTMHDNVAASGTIDLEVLSLSVGLHTVHYQTFTADGMASSVRTRYFLVNQPDKRQLTSRVWIDDDTENAVTQQLTDEPILLDLDGLTGEHQLHVELYDAAGLLVGEQTKSFVADEGNVTSSKLVVTNLEIVGEGKVGADHTVKALVKNEGADFYGNVAYFSSLDPSNVGRKQSTIRSRIASGEENRSFSWEFIPENAGTYYITIGIVDDSGQLLEVIGRTTFEVNDISGNISTSLAISDVSGLIGNTFTLPVSMINVDEITAMQFELSLPDGVSVAGATLTDRKNGHTIDYSQLANGSYQFTLFSGASKAFSGNEGVVANISLSVSGSMTVGDYTIQMKNIELTTTAAIAINPADQSVTLTVSNIKLGDVNGDDRITITDAVGIVNYILGNPSATFHAEAADVNGDSKISITDAVAVVNIILNQSSSVKEHRMLEREREPQ